MKIGIYNSSSSEDPITQQSNEHKTAGFHHSLLKQPLRKMILYLISNYAHMTLIHYNFLWLLQLSAVKSDLRRYLCLLDAFLFSPRKTSLLSTIDVR